MTSKEKKKLIDTKLSLLEDFCILDKHNIEQRNFFTERLRVAKNEYQIDQITRQIMDEYFDIKKGA